MTSQNLSNVVSDYGADPTGKTDCSGAFQKAADSSQSIFVPGGSYRFTAGFTIKRNGQRFVGAGKAQTVLSPVGAFDLVTFTGNEEGGGLEHLTIGASGMTGGFAVVINQYNRSLLQQVHIDRPYNGVSVYQSSTTYLWGVRVTGARGDVGVLYSGKGTDRSDQLNLFQCAITGEQGSTTTNCIVMDGNVHTLRITDTVTQFGNVGLWMRNTLAGDLNPSGVQCEVETNIHTAEGVRLDAGSGFHARYLYGNTSPTTPPSSNADWLYIASVFDDVQLAQLNVAGSGKHGVNINGTNVRVIGGRIGTPSLVEAKTYSAFYVGPTANYVTIMGVTTVPGNAHAAYGVDIAKGAQNVDILPSNLAGALGAYRDQSGTGSVYIQKRG